MQSKKVENMERHKEENTTIHNNTIQKYMFQYSAFQVFSMHTCLLKTFEFVGYLGDSVG